MTKKELNYKITDWKDLCPTCKFVQKEVKREGVDILYSYKDKEKSICGIARKWVNLYRNLEDETTYKQLKLWEV